MAANDRDSCAAVNLSLPLMGIGDIPRAFAGWPAMASLPLMGIGDAAERMPAVEKELGSLPLMGIGDSTVTLPALMTVLLLTTPHGDRGSARIAAASRR